MEPAGIYAIAAKKFDREDKIEDYPTPPWATRALIEHVIGKDRVRDQNVWEPAANRGYMARPLQEYFKSVSESDIQDYTGEGNTCDFLAADNMGGLFNWVITNPPFTKAQQFIEKAQTIATDGVAMLVRTSFLEGCMRYNTLYMHNPPDIVAQFAGRVPMVKGRMDKQASTATSYAWLVWYIDNLHDLEKVTVLRWIPPCRKELERNEDYA
jgi:hypothetical protein